MVGIDIYLSSNRLLFIGKISSILGLRDTPLIEKNLKTDSSRKKQEESWFKNSAPNSS